MDGINAARYFERLSKRRRELVATLNHLAKERQQVESNTDWLDQTAYQNRRRLLERLHDWYRTELVQIERALGRIDNQTYGLCAACHKPIDAQRLKCAPQAEFCLGCEELREHATAA